MDKLISANRHRGLIISLVSYYAGDHPVSNSTGEKLLELLRDIDHNGDTLLLQDSILADVARE